jgi:hypothetical protein
MRTDGQTDMIKRVVDFRNFMEVPEQLSFILMGRRKYMCSKRKVLRAADIFGSDF